MKRVEYACNNWLAGTLNLMLFAINRNRRRLTARRAFGAFVVVWLNLILQPCAMAIGSEPDCPNCPPSHTHFIDGHKMASSDTVKQAMPCASGAVDCDILDDFNHDGRTAQLKVKDAPDELPIALLSATDLASGIKPVSQPDPSPVCLDPPGPPPALTKLYCVYLK